MNSLRLSSLLFIIVTCQFDVFEQVLVDEQQHDAFLFLLFTAKGNTNETLNQGDDGQHHVTSDHLVCRQNASSISRYRLRRPRIYHPNIYDHHRHHHLPPIGGARWGSSAIGELVQAILKVTILVVLKMFLKYFLLDRLKTARNPIVPYSVVNFASKAVTIALAKYALTGHLYSALRTASKTLLIVLLKSMLYPLSRRLKLSQSDPIVPKWVTNVSLEICIKTLALKLLLLVFERDEATCCLSLPELMLRVALIIIAKKACKRYALDKIYKPNKKAKKSIDPMDLQPRPGDKLAMFAFQKLATKLVRIPVVKLLQL